MVGNGRVGEAEFHLPRGESYEPPDGLARTFSKVPRGPALLGLALAAALAGTALIIAGRRLAGPGGERLKELATRAPERLRKHRKSRSRPISGFWGGVLASAGSAVAGVIARRLAEELIETARRERVEERPVEE